MKLTDSEKLKIAIEALEYFNRMRKDSRDWGLIKIKIDEALKLIK